VRSWSGNRRVCQRHLAKPRRSLCSQHRATRTFLFRRGALTPSLVSGGRAREVRPVTLFPPPKENHPKLIISILIIIRR
jgi:hypothetical protein